MRSPITFWQVPVTFWQLAVTFWQLAITSWQITTCPCFEGTVSNQGVGVTRTTRW